jgi:hypothetical protein
MHSVLTVDLYHHVNFLTDALQPLRTTPSIAFAIAFTVESSSNDGASPRTAENDV